MGTCNARVCTLLAARELTPGIADIRPVAASPNILWSLFERAEVAEVEHGAEVDVKTVGSLATKRFARITLSADAYYRLGRQGGVIRGRERADVARRDRQPLPQHHPVRLVGQPRRP